MPFANNITISQKPLDGGIEITDAQYKSAVQAKMAGKEIRIIDDELAIASDTVKTIYSMTDGKSKTLPDNFPVEDGFTEIERPSEFHNWSGGKWVLDDAAQRAASIPAVVTMRQARAALIITGNIDLIQPAIDDIVDPIERALAQNEWDRSQTVERNRGLVQQIGSKLFTDEQLDDLFILAGQQA